MNEEINKILDDHEKRLSKIEKAIFSKKVKVSKASTISTWYKKGSTIEKVVQLIAEGFFDEYRSISDIISALKSKDYHFKSSDLTLPLRKIVRRGLLKKTKDLPDGKKTKNWMYIKQ